MSQADVVICVPTRGRVRIEFAVSLAGLHFPVNTTHALKIIPGLGVDEARNVAVLTAREADARYMLFIDDDVLVPPHAPRRMVSKLEQEPEWDLVTGIVPVKSEPVEPCVFRGHRPGPYWGWTFGEHFEIDSCGMACCLIRTSAFEKVAEPWFAWTRTQKGSSRDEEGEDVGFCRKLQEAGGRLLADGGVLCGHITEEGKVYQLSGEEAPFRGESAKKLLRRSTGLAPADRTQVVA